MVKKKEEIQTGPKQQLSFTLKKGVKEKYLTYCKDNMFNKSEVLESLIVAFLDSKEFAGMKRVE